MARLMIGRATKNATAKKIADLAGLAKGSRVAVPAPETNGTMIDL